MLGEESTPDGQLTVRLKVPSPDKGITVISRLSVFPAVTATVPVPLPISVGLASPLYASTVIDHAPATRFEIVAEAPLTAWLKLAPAGPEPLIM
jgi:hypothetical protein